MVFLNSRAHMHSATPVNRQDTLGVMVNALHALAIEAANLTVPDGSWAASVGGHKFEDDAAKVAYEELMKRGLTPLLPRHTLHLPTLSGLHQQFDLVVPNKSHYYIAE